MPFGQHSISHPVVSIGRVAIDLSLHVGKRCRLRMLSISSFSGHIGHRPMVVQAYQRG